MTKKTNNKVKLQIVEVKENRKINASQALDMFLKQLQIGNKTISENKNPCDKYCRSKRCQRACHFIKTKTFDINLHDWDKYRST